MRSELLTVSDDASGCDTAQLASPSVEGVPAEIAGFISQTIRRVGVRTLSATVEVLGAGCEGYWASLDLHDMIASGSVCASGARPERLGWLQRFPLPPAGWHEANGWTLDRHGWCSRTPMGHVRNPRELRGAVTQLMLAAQAMFGVLPPWAWHLRIDPDPHLRVDPEPLVFVDLRRLGNGGVAPIRDSPARAAGCVEAGIIAHEIGRCHLHAPCVGLRGCGTTTRTFTSCDGCFGVDRLLQRPADPTAHVGR